VSLHKFLCILIRRSLSNLKEKYTTAFRHKRIHTALHNPKQVERSIMAASPQIPAVFHNSGRLLHHTHYARSRWCTVHCTPLQLLWIYD